MTKKSQVPRRSALVKVNASRVRPKKPAKTGVKTASKLPKLSQQSDLMQKLQSLLGQPQALEKEQVDILEGFGLTVKKKMSGNYVVEDALISPLWRVGGMEGGNCWGNTPDEPVSCDPKPRWLEAVMEKLCPDITYLKFRRLEDACARHMITKYGYYGNYDECLFEILRLSDLLEILPA